jgi:hypothetical protein
MRNRRVLQEQEEEWCVEIGRNIDRLSILKRVEEEHTAVYGIDNEDMTWDNVWNNAVQDNNLRDEAVRLQARNEELMVLLSSTTDLTAQSTVPQLSVRDQDGDSVMECGAEETKSDSSDADEGLPANRFDGTCSLNIIHYHAVSRPWRLVLVDPEFRRVVAKTVPVQVLPTDQQWTGDETIAFHPYNHLSTNRIVWTRPHCMELAIS